MRLNGFRCVSCCFGAEISHLSWWEWVRPVSGASGTFPFKEGAQKLLIFLKAKAPLSDFMHMCGQQRHTLGESARIFYIPQLGFLLLQQHLEFYCFYHNTTSSILAFLSFVIIPANPLPVTSLDTDSCLLPSHKYAPGSVDCLQSSSRLSHQHLSYLSLYYFGLHHTGCYC